MQENTHELIGYLPPLGVLVIMIILVQLLLCKWNGMNEWGFWCYTRFICMLVYSKRWCITTLCPCPSGMFMEIWSIHKLELDLLVKEDPILILKHKDFLCHDSQALSYVIEKNSKFGIFLLIQSTFSCNTCILQKVIFTFRTWGETINIFSFLNFSIYMNQMIWLHG